MAPTILSLLKWHERRLNRTLVGCCMPWYAAVLPGHPGGWRSLCDAKLGAVLHRVPQVWYFLFFLCVFSFSLFLVCVYVFGLCWFLFYEVVTVLYIPRYIYFEGYFMRYLIGMIVCCVGGPWAQSSYSLLRLLGLFLINHMYYRYCIFCVFRPVYRGLGQKSRLRYWSYYTNWYYIILV